MLKSITAAALVLALSSPALADAAQEIRQANEKFMAAFNKGDAAGVAALYTEDARLMPPGAATISGRQGVEAFWKGAIDSGLKNLTLTTVEVESFGDAAQEVGSAAFDVPGQNGSPVRVEGKYVVLWRKASDGAWRLGTDIWNMNR